MKKNLNRKKIVILSFALIIILLIVAYFIVFINRDTSKSNIIVATKTEERDGNNIEIKYKIQISNYDISKIEKTLTFNTEEEASREYEVYQIINKSEEKGMDLKLNKKNLITILPIELFKEEIDYQDENTFSYLDENGEISRIISQNELIKTLENQGYTIK